MTDDQLTAIVRTEVAAVVDVRLATLEARSDSAERSAERRHGELLSMLGGLGSRVAETERDLAQVKAALAERQRRSSSESRRYDVAQARSDSQLDGLRAEMVQLRSDVRQDVSAIRAETADAIVVIRDELREWRAETLQAERDFRTHETTDVRVMLETRARDAARAELRGMLGAVGRWAARVGLRAAPLLAAGAGLTWLTYWLSTR
jgi:chromosome segregation ATPase